MVSLVFTWIIFDHIFLFGCPYLTGNYAHNFFLLLVIVFGSKIAFAAHFPAHCRVMVCSCCEQAVHVVQEEASEARQSSRSILRVLVLDHWLWERSQIYSLNKNCSEIWGWYTFLDDWNLEWVLKSPWRQWNVLSGERHPWDGSWSCWAGCPQQRKDLEVDVVGSRCSDITWAGESRWGNSDVTIGFHGPFY